MSHRAQHRPTSESPKKELAHYKSENRLLRKQVARLQKELTRTVETNNGLTEPLDIDETPIVSCSKCGSKKNRLTFTTPSGKVISRCPGCKS